MSAAMTPCARDEINPAIRRYRDFLARTYLPAAREDLGVAANPDGRACYDASVRFFSTLAMPADSVYEIAIAKSDAMAETIGRETGTPVFALDWLLGVIAPFKILPSNQVAAEIGYGLLTMLARRQFFGHTA